MNEKISVVTVVRNGEKHIEKTILSVINQKYSNVEYIIIDGMSTDGTQNIIDKYCSKINLVVREPDTGIYDAMNKGISVATGDWINFMNVGDQFYSDNVLDKLFTNNVSDYDIIYGDSCNQYLDLGFNGRVIPAPLNKLFFFQIMDHQSLFVRSKIIKDIKFKLKYKLAADYNLILHSYIQGYKFHHADEIVTLHSYGINGASESNRLKSALERWKIVQRYRKDLSIRIYYYFDFLKCFLKDLSRKYIPFRIQYSILKIKYLLRNYNNKKDRFLNNAH